MDNLTDSVVPGLGDGRQGGYREINRQEATKTRKILIALLILFLLAIPAGAIELKGEHQFAYEFGERGHTLVSSEVISTDVGAVTVSMTLEFGKNIGADNWSLLELAASSPVWIFDINVGSSYRWDGGLTHFLMVAYPW